MEPLAVGLIGAGPWARMVHAPVLAAGPETRLAGVWSRTADHASALAASHGVPAFARVKELLDTCEAVALCVAPAAQPPLAVQAARAGKALLLEKPLAADVEGASAVADAVGEAGVGSVVVLSYRFSDHVRDFLSRVPALSPEGGRACFFSNAFAAGPFAYGWRLEDGCLLDVGPHAIDLADAALGPVASVRAHGHPRAYVGLLLEHEGGAVSEVSLSCTAGVEGSRTEVEVFGPHGSLSCDARAGMGPATFATLRREFVEAARAGGGHACDAQRGLHLQRILAAAAQDLARSSS